MIVIKPKILVIDDEIDICELLTISLRRMGAEVIAVHNIAAAKLQLTEHLVDFVLTDLRISTDNGLEVVKYLATNYPAIPCAVITAHGDMQTAIAALQQGAFDFVAKPIELVTLQRLFETGLKLSKTHQWGKINVEQLIGESEPIKQLKKLLPKAAENEIPVIIEGPAGSGKNLLAKAIHRASSRYNKPLFNLNISAVKAEELNATLFGDHNQNGILQKANGATLLINEIEVLPPELQAKLAEILQMRQMDTPAGKIILDIKLIVTSLRNLLELTKRHLFRTDLYYQLSVITLHTPALATIANDIPMLIEYNLDKLTRYSHLLKPKISPRAMKTLLNYNYPGNVRELKTILQRAIALCDNNEIDVTDLQLDVTSISMNNEVKIMKSEPLLAELEELEKQRILQALHTSQWNKTKAAKKLGMTFRALRYRLKKFSIN